MTDAELIRRSRDGNDEALGELFGRYQTQLYGFLVKMTRSRRDAEDLFQETFLRIHRMLDGYREQQRFKSLLFTVASNLCIDHARRRKTRLAVVEDEHEDFPLAEIADAGPEWKPDRMLESSQLQELLNEAVDSLPDAQRQLVLLRLETGMTFQEIADLRGEPLGTVLPRMHRAVRSIRRYFQEHGYETS